MKRASQAVSVFFHPMLMPSLGLIILFTVGTHLTYISIDAKRLILLVVFITTAVFPLSVLPLLYHLGVIKNFQMETARERLIPLLLTWIFFYLGFVALKKMGVSGIILGFMLGSLITVGLSALITLFWKISIHMIAIGGVTGAIIAVGYRYNGDIASWAIMLFLAAGLTAAARLYLGAHNPAQVYAGYLLGLMVVAGATLI